MGRAARGIPGVLAVVALLAPVRGTRAQAATLTLTNAPNVFPTPTVTDYDAGVVTEATGITFTVDITTGPNVLRTTIVSLRATSATLGGGKPVGDLEWRRADLATWNTMTTADVVVESRSGVRRVDPPWSNTVFFRILLSWTGDPPGTYSAPLVFALTVTTP